MTVSLENLLDYIKLKGFTVDKIVLTKEDKEVILSRKGNSKEWIREIRDRPPEN